jgi:DNA-binding transcriptional ArsR family regulator
VVLNIERIAVKKVDLETWKLMMAPARVDIIETLRSLGQCTIKQLATSLGRSPQSIYPHIEQLIEADIIKQERVRTSEGRSVTCIELSADDFSPDLQAIDGDGLNVLAQVTIDALTRSVNINSRRASTKGLFQMIDGQPNSFFMHELIWLDDEQLSEFRALMRQAKAMASRCKKPTSSRKYFAVSFLMPAD